MYGVCMQMQMHMNANANVHANGTDWTGLDSTGVEWNACMHEHTSNIMINDLHLHQFASSYSIQLSRAAFFSLTKEQGFEGGCIVVSLNYRHCYSTKRRENFLQS